MTQEPIIAEALNAPDVINGTDLPRAEVFGVEELLQSQRQQILSDLIKIANQGEYEDMRREIERYNNL